jgi:hypothetical protein
MNNKLNREDIELMIPDYITGSLNETEMKIVEEALDNSAELREFYSEMKGALDIAHSVKFEDPPQAYFNNLLPRIHEKIESRQSKRSLWDSISIVWKIAVPVAAVLLVFVVYQLLTSPEGQLTKKETEKVLPKTDTSLMKKDVQEQNKNTEIKKEEPKPEEDMISDRNNEKRGTRKSIQRIDKQNSRNKELPDEMKNEEIKIENEPVAREEIVSIDPEETSVFAGGAPGALDAETDKELDELNSTEKDMLIEDLIKSNL